MFVNRANKLKSKSFRIIVIDLNSYSQTKVTLFFDTIDVISMSFAIRGHNCHIVPLLFFEKEHKVVKVSA